MVESNFYFMVIIRLLTSRGGDSMTLEWFDRVCGELQDSLDSICSKYNETGGMSIERGAKHPRVDFFIENEGDNREYFCTLFLIRIMKNSILSLSRMDLGHTGKVVLADIEDIIDAVHESFYMYMDDDLLEEEMIEDEYDYYDSDSDQNEEAELLEEIDVQWETPEVTAYYQENEVEVSYQFGIIEETGDGVLKRINRIWTEDEDLIKDESHFIFSREEASTIIAMIASHMDSLSTMNDYK